MTTALAGRVDKHGATLHDHTEQGPRGQLTR